MKTIELRFNTGTETYQIKNVEVVNVMNERLNVSYTPENRPDQQHASYDLKVIKGYVIF